MLNAARTIHPWGNNTSIIDKPVSSYAFHHDCAMHMLRSAARIRQLQEMLGHASPETTQLYTRVAINEFRAMHRKLPSLRASRGTCLTCFPVTEVVGASIPAGPCHVNRP